VVLEPPAAGEGLEAVVGAAQAAEVGAVRRPACGVRDDVVGVGPADALAAGGEAAAAVAGAHERLLRRRGGVAVDGVGPVEHRAATIGAGVGVLGAAAGGDAAQPLQRRGGAQPAVLVGQRQRH
jgi:hypothetical protein